jgi:hypothetical protein
MGLTFKEKMARDFTEDAIFIVGNNPKVIKVHVFKNSLDQMETLYTLIWCSLADIPYVKKNDRITIGTVTYGIVDFEPDDMGLGINIFVNKVV